MITIILFIGCCVSQRFIDLPKYDEESFVSDFTQMTDDLSALKLFEKIRCDQTTIIGRKVLEFAICQGWNQSSFMMVNHFNALSVDLYQIFVQARKCLHIKYLPMFNQLSRQLPEDSVFLNIIEPCYLWAQNMTHLFLKIKFTIKLDVPGVIEINRLDTNITMPQFFLNAYSFHQVPLRFMLRIRTYKFMNPHYYHSYEAELGQVVYEILKSPSPYFWRNVHYDWFYNPPNQYIWWDMFFQYREQLKVAFGLMDDAENIREDKEAQKLLEEDNLIEGRRKFQKRLEEEKAYLKQEQLFQMYCRLSPSQMGCLKLDPNQWNSWV